MEDEFVLTVEANPFNPFTNFDEWNRWDIEQGYNTNAYLARIVNSTSEFGEAIENEQILEAMQAIVKMFPETYKIVRPKDYDNGDIQSI